LCHTPSLDADYTFKRPDCIAASLQETQAVNCIIGRKAVSLQRWPHRLSNDLLTPFGSRHYCRMCRTSCLSSVNYSDAIYSVEALRWTRTSYIQPQIHPYDKCVCWLEFVYSCPPPPPPTPTLHTCFRCDARLASGRDRSLRAILWLHRHGRRP